MKINQEGFYKCRDGSKAEVYYSGHGYVFGHFYSGHPVVWYSVGLCIFVHGGTRSYHGKDIVEEWQEPDGEDLSVFTLPYLLDCLTDRSVCSDKIISEIRSRHRNNKLAESSSELPDLWSDELLPDYSDGFEYERDERICEREYAGDNRHGNPLFLDCQGWRRHKNNGTPCWTCHGRVIERPKEEAKEKCKACPECGCSKFMLEDDLGSGSRVCVECKQEWWTDIDYTKPPEPKEETCEWQRVWSDKTDCTTACQKIHFGSINYKHDYCSFCGKKITVKERT